MKGFLVQGARQAVAVLLAAQTALRSFCCRLRARAVVGQAL